MMERRESMGVVDMLSPADSGQAFKSSAEFE